MGERLNNSPKDLNTIVRMLEDKNTADDTKRYLFGLEPKDSLEYAVKVIEFAGEEFDVDEQMNQWKILAAESLFALKVESWRELETAKFKLFKRTVIDKFGAKKADLPANSHNIILFWMQQNKIKKGARQPQELKKGGFSEKQIIKIKRTYDRLLRGDFSDEEHTVVWYPVSDIATKNNTFSQEFITTAIDEVLEALASSQGDTFDESSLIKYEQDQQFISPEMYQYLRYYPAFQKAPKTWIRVLGNNGKPQDQSIIEAYTRYKLKRIGLDLNTKLSEVDEGVLHSFYVYVQSQHMLREEEDIGWFYNPETGEVEEYFSQDVLTRLFSTLEKPKAKKRKEP